MKILVCEPDKTLRRGLLDALTLYQHSVEAVRTLDDATELLRNFSFDIAVLDQLSPATAVKELRHLGVTTPILILTANYEQDVCGAFNAGADEVMAKPFDVRELLARMQAVVRRMQWGSASNVIEAGAVKVDLDRDMAFVNDRRIDLSGTEYRVLRRVIQQKGKCVTREMLFCDLYRSDSSVQTKILDVMICKVRRKLAKAGMPERFIRTIHGRGYMAPANGVWEAA